MKRCIGALLVLCMVMMTCCVGFAADAVENDVFTMPNGVQFGMTWEEVDALEAGARINDEYGTYRYTLTKLGSVDLTEYFSNAYVEYIFTTDLGLGYIYYYFDVTMPKPGHTTDCLLEFAVVENGLIEELQLLPVGMSEYWRPGVIRKTSEEGRALAILTGEMELSSARNIRQDKNAEVWLFHSLGFNVFGTYEHTILFANWIE